MSEQMTNDKPPTPREQRAQARAKAGEKPVSIGPRYYDASKNPDESRYITGVPLCDLSADEFASLPEHLQRAVDGSDMYSIDPIPEPITDQIAGPVAPNTPSIVGDDGPELVVAAAPKPRKPKEE